MRLDASCILLGFTTPMLAVLETILHILLIAIGVGFLIFVHELGHFLVAKKIGVRVEAFSLGFGPVLIKFKRGDTEYRLSAIMLGGYVKMAGENPGEERTGAPYELQSQPPMRRLPIFLAGSVINFIAAFPLCVLAYAVGMNLPAPVVGNIRDSSSEWDSLMMPGDVIELADDRQIEHLDAYRKYMMQAPLGKDVAVTVRRDGVRFTIPVVARGSAGVGVQPSIDTVVGEVISGSPAEQAGIREGDRLLELDGRPIRSAPDFLERIQKLGGTSVRLRVLRRDGTTADIVLTPTIQKTSYEVNLKQYLTFQLDRIKRGGPADGFLLGGDVPLDIDGKPARSWASFTEKVSAAAGKTIAITVERNKQRVTVNITPIPDEKGKGKIYVTPKFLPVVASVPPDSPLARAEYGDTRPPTEEGQPNQNEPPIREGTRIITVAGKSFGRIEETFPLFQKPEPVPIPMTVETNGKVYTVKVMPEKVDYASIGVELMQKSVFYRADGVWEAVRMGAVEMFDNFMLTLVFLVRLIGLTESPKDMAGPIGIASASYVVVKESFGRFLWLLSLLSLSLAVFNMLPIPILDGGHVAFLIIEKFRGKPLSEKVLIMAQYVGLVLLLSLILYVTYADIARLVRF